MPVPIFRCLFALVLAAAVSRAQEPVDFRASVLPLLEAKCVGCHNAKLSTGGLALDSREALLAGGGRGPAVAPGDPEASPLIQAVRRSGDLKMPPAGPLAPEETTLLERWVAGGAQWDGQVAAEAARPTHWSFQPIRRPAPPAAVDASLVRNPIDRFVQAKLAALGLKPSPEAGRATLIRRLSLDLTGLPPTPGEIRAFVEDTRPDAYAQLAERLLASPHYGERWGRHWLDIAHYADSNGYNQDHPREIWMYRDWVIDALNRDLPFDRFVVEQVAGDLLPSPTQDQLVATGFHRNTLINLEGGIDFEQYRADAVADRVDTVGAAFLGLTVGCARCHDHKYDPIAQRDYYRLYAFYDSIDELSGADGEAGRRDPYKPVLEFGPPDVLKHRVAVGGQVSMLENDLKRYEEVLAQRQPAWEASLAERMSELSEEIQYSLRTPAAERNEFQVAGIRRIYHDQDEGWKQRQSVISMLRKRLPKVDSTMVMRELPEPRESYIHLGGDFLRKGETVQPGTPAALASMEVEGRRATRLDLANWLVSADNPLTARVTVNRVWQRYFGLGIVETENDFGTQGAPPSHPELLDWLAAEFRDKGWSQKDLHRTIVRSHAYRQASQHREELTEADPRNRLLGRQNRIRLEAEVVRDVALAASGLFNPEVGGPSVFPPQPDGASKLGQMQRDWVEAADKSRYRRGMYTYFWRASPHPGLMIFDAPDSTAACTRRVRSNTPLQALTLLNDKGYYEMAQNLAKRVLDEGGASNGERLERAFEICIGRAPGEAERDELSRFLAEQLDSLQTRPEDAQAIAATPELAAWTAVSRVLLNLDEFITRE